MAKKAEEVVNIKLIDFIGKKLKDISQENETLTIKFENGYNIKVSGNVILKKEREED